MPCVLRRFLSHLLLFLHLDSGVPQGVTQQVTHKVAQHLTGASHGDNVKLLNSMIQVRVPPAPKCTLACLPNQMLLVLARLCVSVISEPLAQCFWPRKAADLGFVVELDVIVFVF